MRITQLGSLCLLLASTTSGQNLSATAKTELGNFYFSDLALYRKPRGDDNTMSQGVNGAIANESAVYWEIARFQIILRGPAPSGEIRDWAFKFNAYAISRGEKRRFAHDLAKEFPSMTVERVTVEFLGGDHGDTEEAEEAAEQVRVRAISKFPVLENGSEVVFIAKDPGCQRDFMAARASGGLESRKKIAELLAFNCGFVIDAGTHAKVLSRSGGLARIVIVKHDLEDGDDGWVPASWLHLGSLPKGAKPAGVTRSTQKK